MSRTFSEGRAVLELAQTNAEYADAARLFGCAIAARPDFARAIFARSIAERQVDTEELGAAFISLPSKDRLPGIVDGQDRNIRALEAAGWTPATKMWSSYAFDTFLLAVSANLPSRLADAAEAAREGLSAAGLLDGRGHLSASAVTRAPLASASLAGTLVANYGLITLAGGDVPAALDAYRAVTRTVAAFNGDLIASAMTDLNVLEAACAAMPVGRALPGCSQATVSIASARHILLTPYADPPSGLARATDVDTWITPSRAGWRATLHGYDAERDRVTAVWEAWVPEWQLWRVVQPLFGSAAVNPRADGSVEVERAYGDERTGCAGAGRYRATIYVNGAPAATGAIHDLGEYASQRSRDLGVSFCSPPGWRLVPVRAPNGSRPLVRIFTNAAGENVAYLFTIFMPPAATDAGARLKARTTARVMVERLSVTPPPPGALEDALDRFRGCGFAVGPGTMLHREWIADSGLAHVVFIVGDRAGRDGCLVLDSAGSVDPWFG
ncbi:MAG TPA: hypothetical protein PLH72_19135 [Vicinamibacterales bacterium]|nr:hypothetical protein [Vicinamibacterales bacterium]